MTIPITLGAAGALLALRDGASGWQIALGIVLAWTAVAHIYWKERA